MVSAYYGLAHYYMGFIKFGIGRTTQAIADAFGIPARDVSRTFNMYQEQVPETSIHVTTPAASAAM